MADEAFTSPKHFYSRTKTEKALKRSKRLDNALFSPVTTLVGNDLVFKIQLNVYLDLNPVFLFFEKIKNKLIIIFFEIKIHNFRGDHTDISAKTQTLLACLN